MFHSLRSRVICPPLSIGAAVGKRACLAGPIDVWKVVEYRKHQNRKLAAMAEMLFEVNNI